MGELLIKGSKSKKEFDFSKDEFEIVRARLKRSAGINLTEAKISMVYSRLSRRIRALGCKSFAEYLERLNTDPQEHENFVNALTTNLTSFFREPHHFDVLKDYVIQNTQPLVIWCAACSTGEEAYSIAITCAEARGCTDHNIKILASDIDSKVMTKAKAGVYQIKAIKDLSMRQRKLFFLKVKDSDRDRLKSFKKLETKFSFFSRIY